MSSLLNKLKRKYGAESVSRRVRLTMRFAWSSPSHVVATFFGAGALRPAPGTWGTAAGIFVYGIIQSVFGLSWTAWLAISAIAFVLGIWAADAVARDLGVEDHSGVVIDEVVAVWLVALGIPEGWLWWFGAFAALRIFDILKLWPGCAADEKLHGGFGVMCGDLVAALYAWLVLAAAQHIIFLGELPSVLPGVFFS